MGKNKKIPFLFLLLVLLILISILLVSSYHCLCNLCGTDGGDNMGAGAGSNSLRTRTNVPRNILLYILGATHGLTNIHPISSLRNPYVSI